MKLCLLLNVLCAVFGNAQTLCGIQSDDGEQSNQTALVSTEDYVRAYRQSDPVKSKQAFEFIAGDKDRFAAIVFEDLIRGDVEIRKRALKLLQKWGAPVDSIDLEKRRRIESEQIGAIDRWLFPVEIVGGKTELNQQQRDKLVALINALATGKTKIDQASVESVSVHRSSAIDLINEKLAANDSEPEFQKLIQLRYLLLAGKQLRKQHFDNLQLLASTDPETRVDALRSILQSTTRYDRPLISQLLSDKDEKVRATAINGLEVFEIWSTEQALEKLIGDDSSEVRSAAMSYISMCPSIEMYAALKKRIPHETDVLILRSILTHLSADSFVSEVGPVIQLVEHEDPAVRMLALRIIARARDSVFFKGDKTELTQAIHKRVLDDNINVATEALDEFGMEQTEKSIEIVADLIAKHPSLFERHGYGIDWKLPNDDDTEDDFEAYYEQQESFTKEKLVPRLLTLTKHQDADVRIAAINVLARFDENEVRSRLLRFLNDNEVKVRIAVLKFIANETQQMRDFWEYKLNGVGTDSDTWFAPDRLMAESASHWISEFWSTIKRVFTIPFFGMKTGTSGSHGVDELPPLYHEQWIKKYIPAMRAVPWLKRVTPRLRTLAKSSDLDESGWAAVCLVAGGHLDSSFDHLMLINDTDLLLFYDGTLLKSVPYKERLLLFKKLSALGFTPEYEFAAVRNYEGINELWKYYAETDDPTWCSEVLEIAYFGQIANERIRRDSENAALLDKFRADLNEKIKTDNPRFQYIALEMMGKYFPDDAIAHATSLSRSSKDDFVKQMAAKIMLEHEGDEYKTTISFLSSDDPNFAKEALSRFCDEDSKKRLLEFELPGQIKPELIRRWADHKNQELQEIAQAVLVRAGLEQDAEELATLLYSNKHVTAAMVIRAIAKTGKDENVKYLEEFYEANVTDEISEINCELTGNMIGQNALELRARIRKEQKRGSALAYIKMSR